MMNVRFFAVIAAVICLTSAGFAFAEQTTVVGREVVLDTSDGVKVYGTWFDAGHGAPVALLVHMMRRDRSDYDNFALDLAQRGISALSIDLRGHGQSIARADGTKLSLPAFTAQDFASMKLDIEAAMKFLGKRKVDKKRIAIVGASIGANTAINFAAEHPDKVKAIVLLSPGLDYRKVLAEPAMKAYSGPVFLAASQNDFYSAKTVAALAAIKPDRVTKRIFGGKAHGTNLFVSDKKFAAELADWLSEKLKS